MAVNKMMIMLPLMFAARKLDGEDPNIVFMLRCSYGIVQSFILLAVLYIFMVATKLSKSAVKDEEIYVPPPPQPFADPNAKTQYTKTTFGEQALSAAKKLLMSTITGICMTTGLHWYKGMIIGLAMQSVMGPFNLFENAFAKAILLGGANIAAAEKKEDGSSLKKHRLFNEKYRDELTEKDEVIDEEGKILVLKKEKGSKKGGAAGKNKEKSFEDILLDTWDLGDKADIGPLMKQLNKANINYKTKENQWTPLMIMTAIGAEGANDAIKKMKSLNASASMTDGEGWNALHWAAFHGCVEGAETLMDVFDGIKLGLHLAKDAEGMTPLELATKEGNDGVATLIKGKIESVLTATGIAEQDGIRKRK